jgi:Uma2 family endonuclease
MTAIEKIMQAPDLRKVLDELEQAWLTEQHRRHTFWADVDESRKAEFIMGEIVYHSPVYGRHWMASTQLCRRLMPYVYDNKLGMVGVEKVMIRLTRNDYEPDICFWTQDRAVEFKQKQSAFSVPDFIVEILSDSTKDRDYGIKMTDYALHKVKEYWIIDTDQNTVEQYLLQDSGLVLAQKLKDGVIESETIKGFSIAVKAIFQE